MKKRNYLVLIPAWLEGAVKAHQRPFREVLDPIALKSILSINDLGFYVATNEIFWDQLPEGLKKTFNPYRIASSNDCIPYTVPDSSGNKPSPDAVKKLCDELNSRFWATSENAIKDPSVLTNAHFFQQNPDQQSSMLSVDYLFDVFEIVEGVYGIRFTRADRSLAFTPQLAQSYSKLLSLLCVSQPFSEVAATAAFEEYVVLSRNLV